MTVSTKDHEILFFRLEIYWGEDWQKSLKPYRPRDFGRKLVTEDDLILYSACEEEKPLEHLPLEFFQRLLDLAKMRKVDESQKKGLKLLKAAADKRIGDKSLSIQDRIPCYQVRDVKDAIEAYKGAPARSEQSKVIENIEKVGKPKWGMFSSNKNNSIEIGGSGAGTMLRSVDSSLKRNWDNFNPFTSAPANPGSGPTAPAQKRPRHDPPSSSQRLHGGRPGTRTAGVANRTNVGTPGAVVDPLRKFQADKTSTARPSNDNSVPSLSAPQKSNGALSSARALGSQSIHPNKTASSGEARSLKPLSDASSSRHKPRTERPMAPSNRPPRRALPRDTPQVALDKSPASRSTELSGKSAPASDEAAARPSGASRLRQKPVAEDLDHDE